MADRNYTVEEVIGATINMLTGIMIPAELAEEIGIPVKYAIKNLRAVMTAIQQDQKKPEAEKPDEKKTEEVDPDGRDDQAE